MNSTVDQEKHLAKGKHQGHEIQTSTKDVSVCGGLFLEFLFLSQLNFSPFLSFFGGFSEKVAHLWRHVFGWPPLSIYYVHITRLVLLPALIQEALLCSEWWWTQSLTTAQGAEQKWQLTAYSKPRHLYHPLSGRKHWKEGTEECDRWKMWRKEKWYLLGMTRPLQSWSHNNFGGLYRTWTRLPNKSIMHQYRALKALIND